MLDSYVMDWGSGRLDEAIQHLLKYGFSRKRSKNFFPDEEEVVMPGAIMSVTPCNAPGYSRHDLEEIKNQRQI